MGSVRIWLKRYYNLQLRKFLLRVSQIALFFYDNWLRTFTVALPFDGTAHCTRCSFRSDSFCQDCIRAATREAVHDTSAPQFFFRHECVQCNVRCPHVILPTIGDDIRVFPSCSKIGS